MTNLTVLPENNQLLKSDSARQPSWTAIWSGALAKTLSFLKTLGGFIPITGMGLAYIILLALTFYFIALGQDDIVWISASVALMVVGILMVLAVSIGAIYLAIHWKTKCEIGLTDINTSTMYQSKTGLELPFLPLPFVNVSIKWLYPLEVESECRQSFSSISEYITVNHRCSVEKISRRFEVEDILGLAKVTWVSTQKVKFKAYPKPGLVKSSSITLSMAGGEDISDPFGSPQGDLIEMRQYVPGDSSRSILWKVYARNRRLVVRMPERALTAQTRTCAYLVSGPNDEASAAFARSILESRILGESWLFGVDGCVGTTSIMSEALDFLASSGNAESRALCGLKKFLEEASKLGYHSCFVFVPAAYGDWVKSVLGAVRDTHLTITWLMGFDQNLTEAENVKKESWQKWLYIETQTVYLEAPSQIAQTLQSPTTPMILCETTTGRIINNAAAYLQAQEKAV